MKRFKTNCLFYCIQKYWELKKLGYKPYFCYSHYHFFIQLQTLEFIYRYEFISKDCNNFLQFIFRILPIYGYENIIIDKLEINNE